MLAWPLQDNFKSCNVCCLVLNLNYCMVHGLNTVLIYKFIYISYINFFPQHSFTQVSCILCAYDAGTISHCTLNRATAGGCTRAGEREEKLPELPEQNVRETEPQQRGNRASAESPHQGEKQRPSRFTTARWQGLQTGTSGARFRF